jgi:uncharacterized protein YybS (DUF2232 family)
MPPEATGSRTKEVAAGVGLTGLIFAISANLPILGFFIALALPLPVLVYRLRLGRKLGAMVAGGAVGLMLLAYGRLTVDLLFFSELLLIGYLLAESLADRRPVEVVVLKPAAAAVLSGVVILTVAAHANGQGLVVAVSEYVATNLALSLKLYESMGIPAEHIRTIERSADLIQEVLIRLMPALAAILALLVSWITLLLARALLRSREMAFPDYGPLNRWKPPETLVWVVIGCGIGVMMPDLTIKTLAINGLLVSLTIYFLAGIAIVAWFFDKKSFPRLVRVFLYSLIVMQQLFLLLVIGLGLFDVWLDFRKLEPKTD